MGVANDGTGPTELHLRSRVILTVDLLPFEVEVYADSEGSARGGVPGVIGRRRRRRHLSWLQTTRTSGPYVRPGRTGRLHQALVCEVVWSPTFIVGVCECTRCLA